jgi:hypothetical protein
MEAAVPDHNRVGINGNVHNSLDDDLVAYRPNGRGFPRSTVDVPVGPDSRRLPTFRAEPGAHPRNPRIATVPIHQFAQARVYPGKMT